MEKGNADERIAGAAKTLFLYCRARTNAKEEAEDLSQEILFELLKSQGSLRDDKAFYGFMWAVAGNVYKNWCKKRAKNFMVTLDDHIADGSASMIATLENETDIRLLYRELIC